MDLMQLMWQKLAAQRFIHCSCYLTQPLMTPSCEQSFSVMRREKTWIRSKSGQNHLKNIMFSHIHKKAMDEINFELVASEFMQHADGRKHYFGVNY